MAIEQWGFFSVPNLLWHRTSVYNGYLRGPLTLTPIAERQAVELSLPVFTNKVCRCWDSNTKPSMRGERSNPLLQLVYIWPQGQIFKVCNIALCSELSIVVLWQSHTWHMSVSSLDDVLQTFMTSVWPSPLASISKLYFQHVSRHYRLCSLPKAYQIWHMGVSCCPFMISEWPWPISWVAGVSLASSINSFFSFPIDLSWSKFWLDSQEAKYCTWLLKTLHCYIVIAG